MMKTDTPPVALDGAARRGACGEGFRYIFGNPWPRALITIVTTFAIFGFSFMTMMPVFARDVLHLDAGGYGALVSAVGLGAPRPRSFMAAVGRPGAAAAARAGLRRSSSALILAAAALAPDSGRPRCCSRSRGCVMALNGIAANNMLQVEAPDDLRGRVMGFYSFIVLGMAPFGSFQAGLGRRALRGADRLALGGMVCFVVAAVVAWRMWGGRLPSRPKSASSRPVTKA